MARKVRTMSPNATIEQSTTDKVYQTAIYARLSIEDSRDKESDSIDNQVYLVQQYIEERPYLSLAAIFTDNGETGTNFNRDGFTAMMEQVKIGKINCIVVKDLSRFGRNYIETGEYLERIFPFMGVRFISINDGLDNAAAGSNLDALIVSLKNLINDVYAKDISQKIISALRTRQENGDYIGNLPPYGYKKSKVDYHKLVIDDETASVVRDIFDWKASGMGYLQIARKLNALGVSSPMKHRLESGELKSSETTKVLLWNYSTIRNITASLMYIGHMVQGKHKQELCNNMPIRQLQEKSEWIVVENTHEAIIDKDTFDKVQEIREKNANKFHRRYDKNKGIPPKNHLFKGLLVCGSCGTNLSRIKISRNSNAYKFICPMQHKNLGANCSLKSIRESQIFDITLSSIKTQVETAVDVSAIIERLDKSSGRNNRKNDVATQMSNLQNEIKRLTTLKAALFESYTDKLLSEDEYIYSKQKYAKRIDEAKVRLEHLQEESVLQSETLTPQNKWLQAFRQFQEYDELNFEMVNALISHVIVHTDSELDYVWNFRSDYDVLNEYVATQGVL